MKSLLSPNTKISKDGINFRPVSIKEVFDSAVAVEDELCGAIAESRDLLFSALEAKGEDPFAHGADCAFADPTGMVDFVFILLQNFDLVRKED